MINAQLKMLHIQTPLYRYENLEKVYESIPKHEDIIWHVSKIKSRETPDSPIWQDKRVKLYDIDCQDNDTVAKRNVCFEQMNEGWFHLLDDDTTFHPNMYGAYLRMIKGSFKGMLVGSQNDHRGKLRLQPSFPRSGYIDTGNVLCHTSLLEKVQWQLSDEHPRDYFFWKNCFEALGKKDVAFTFQVISNYNTLRP